MEYNLYCDESSHLMHSKNKIMTLGFISCDKKSSKKANYELRLLKEKYNLNQQTYELKWTKVSKGQMEYFKSVIDYFFDNKYLNFRVVIADKSNLNYINYNINHDDWYYRMYYLLLGKTLIESDEYNIYLDIKDTRSKKKVNKLLKVLNNSYYSFSNNMIKKIQHVRSEEIELIQLCDLFIGAVSYKNNKLLTSPAKLELVHYLENKAEISLLSSTYKSEEKFNIFKWEANFEQL